MVASIIALLNDARLQAGLRPLGFLNPALYTVGGVAALRDITIGNSVGCNGVNGQNGQQIPDGAQILFAAWGAAPGWDAVTGLGVPDFGKLRTWALAVGNNTAVASTRVRGGQRHGLEGRDGASWESFMALVRRGIRSLGGGLGM